MMWRSLLFVPVLEDRFIEKAGERGADGVVLDLEASVAETRKDEARGKLARAVASLKGKADVTVRINPLWLDAIRDLEASVIDGVMALHLARCEGPEEVRAVDGIVSELEAARGLPDGALRLVPMLESPRAILQAEAVGKASKRVVALTMGVEDYSTAMGTSASTELLIPAGFQVIQAARAAGCTPLVVPSSMAEFRDLEGLERAAAFARKLGSTGGYAVHPAQVAVLNRVFSPTEAELAWARRVLEAVDAPENAGRGAFKVDGQMIDLPLIKRARNILGQR